jgi:hypothetical protein
MKFKPAYRPSPLEAFVALALVLAGCKREQNAAAPTSTFTGKVLLYDEQGIALSDNSGATVSLYDNPGVSTSTAADGSFMLTNVAAGRHRLKVEKYPAPSYYGTYYSDELEATAATYALPKPIHLGQRLLSTQNYYSVTCRKDNTNNYVIISGVRHTTIATDTRSLYHRIFIDAPVGYDGYLELQSFNLNQNVRKKLATGFSDTIRYAALTAANARQSTNLVVLNDNPKADSCIAPVESTFPNDKTIVFARAYPAVGGFMQYEFINWVH